MHLLDFSHVIALAFSTALVLWGLRLFKLLVILTGISIGAAVGAALGGLATGSAGGAITGLILLAIIGGVVAWPLQKAIVFLLVGATAAFIAVVLSVVMGVAADARLAIGVVGFLLGGTAAVFLYEYVIVLTLSLTAAGSVFGTFYLVDLGSMLNTRHSLQLLDLLIRAYTQHFGTYIMLCAGFSVFGLAYQKNVLKLWDALPGSPDRATRFTWICAALSIFGYAVFTTLPHRSFDVIHDQVFAVLGMNAVTWPVAALVLTLGTGLAERLYGANSKSGMSFLQKYVASTILVVAVLPGLDYLVYSGVTFRPAPSAWFHGYFGSAPFRAWGSPEFYIGLKYLVAFLLLPVLLATSWSTPGAGVAATAQTRIEPQWGRERSIEDDSSTNREHQESPNRQSAEPPSIQVERPEEGRRVDSASIKPSHYRGRRQRYVYREPETVSRSERQTSLTRTERPRRIRQGLSLTEWILIGSICTVAGILVIVLLLGGDSRRKGRPDMRQAVPFDSVAAMTMRAHALRAQS